VRNRHDSRNDPGFGVACGLRDHVLNAFELKIPPPVIGLLIATAMWAIAYTSADPQTLTALRLPLAGALAAIGALFDFSALLAFHRAKTTVNPMKPGTTSTIVRSGVYRITRNPMYVGLAFFLCAWAAYLWSAWALIGPLAFVAYISRFQIVPEEKTLARLFGEDYLAYKATVRRWL